MILNRNAPKNSSAVRKSGQNSVKKKSPPSTITSQDILGNKIAPHCIGIRKIYHDVATLKKCHFVFPLFQTQSYNHLLCHNIAYEHHEYYRV